MKNRCKICSHNQGSDYVEKMLSTHPSFNAFITNIFEKSSFQKKYILSHLSKTNAAFWDRAEKFSHGFIELIGEKELSLGTCADAYLKMCEDMLKAQIKFRRSGKYTCESAAQAEALVYSSEKEMTSYMLGVALSQFLWPNHYAMYEFFINETKKLESIKSYLEIGPGHGLYLVEAMRNLPRASFRAIDISPISKRISESIVGRFADGADCTFEVKDVNELEDGCYDYIAMGEVLEHLDDPKPVLASIKERLNDNGHFFLSTCANCPAVDHVYHFKNVEEIRQEIHDSGFRITAETALPVYDMPEEQWAEQLAEINYAAMLIKNS